MVKMKTRAKNFLSGLKKRWMLLIVLAAVVLLGGFILYRTTQAQKPDYTFIQPELKTLTKNLEVSGVLDAKEKANLRFAAGGKITFIGVQEGDSVKKFQTIAIIDQATLQKKLNTDLNTYLKERLDWEQTLDNTKNRTLPESEKRTVQQNQLDLNNNVLNVEIQDIAIKNTRLTAPFAGVLVASPVTTSGVTLLPTDIFELVNPESLIFRAAVDEADIALVLQGQVGSITLDAYPNDPITTQVNHTDLKSSQSSNGTVFVVELPISGTFPRYRLGMNGDVSIQLAQKENVLSIPLDATKLRDNKTFVDVKISETEVEEREITTGLETDTDVEVLSGLAKDDWIVLPK